MFFDVFLLKHVILETHLCSYIIYNHCDVNSNTQILTDTLTQSPTSSLQISLHQCFTSSHKMTGSLFPIFLIVWTDLYTHITYYQSYIKAIISNKPIVSLNLYMHNMTFMKLNDNLQIFICSQSVCIVCVTWLNRVKFIGYSNVYEIFERIVIKRVA